jgi:hypothetical protein
MLEAQELVTIGMQNDWVATVVTAAVGDQEI